MLLLDTDVIFLRRLDKVFTWCTPVMASDLPPSDFKPAGMFISTACRICTFVCWMVSGPLLL